MIKRYYFFALLFVFFFASIAGAQHPILDMVTDNVIEKYQNATCEQLWQEKAQKQGKPKTEKEQELIQLLKQNPQLRNEFINKVAAPVVNKMFECGMVP